MKGGQNDRIDTTGTDRRGNGAVYILVSCRTLEPSAL